MDGAPSSCAKLYARKFVSQLPGISCDATEFFNEVEDILNNVQLGRFVCSLDSWRYFSIEIAINCTFNLESMSFGIARKPVFKKPGKISKMALIVHRLTSEDGHIAFMVNLGQFNVSNNMFQD